jgi:hypothetical protein
VSGYQKLRGKIMTAPAHVDPWITTDEISREHFLQAVSYGEIDKDSLGFFTGFLDIYGREIYTGDIVKDERHVEYKVIEFRSECV